jgi:hypothetical protein
MSRRSWSKTRIMNLVNAQEAKRRKDLFGDSPPPQPARKKKQKHKPPEEDLPTALDLRLRREGLERHLPPHKKSHARSLTAFEARLVASGYCRGIATVVEFGPDGDVWAFYKAENGKLVLTYDPSISHWTNGRGAGRCRPEEILAVVISLETC